MIPIWGFVAVTVPLVLTPGASTAVVLRNAVAGGTRAGCVTALGVNAGSACYGILTAFGLALALARWPAAWTMLRVAGVGYLAWLGLRSLRRAVLTRLGPSVASEGAAPRHATAYLYEGFLTNALNPSIATLYLVVLPQFVPRGSPIATSVLMLTAVHIGLAISWHVCWAAAGGTLARVLADGWPRRLLEGVTAAMLLSLALKIAVG